MTVEEFAQGPAQSGILTDREVVQLFLHFTVSCFCSYRVHCLHSLFSMYNLCPLSSFEWPSNSYCRHELSVAFFHFFDISSGESKAPSELPGYSSLLHDWQRADCVQVPGDWVTMGILWSQRPDQVCEKRCVGCQFQVLVLFIKCMYVCITPSLCIKSAMQQLQDFSYCRKLTFKGVSPLGHVCSSSTLYFYRLLQ